MLTYWNSSTELIKENDELDEIILINKRMKRGSYLRIISPNTNKQDDDMAEIIADQDLIEKSNRIYESKKFRMFKKDMISAVTFNKEEKDPLGAGNMPTDMTLSQYSDHTYGSQELKQINKRIKRGSSQRAIMLKSF